MATRPTNASAIKYAVMSFSFDLDQGCGTNARAIISRANLVSMRRKRTADDFGNSRQGSRFLHGLAERVSINRAGFPRVEIIEADISEPRIHIGLRFRAIMVIAVRVTIHIDRSGHRDSIVIGDIRWLVDHHEFLSHPLSDDCPGGESDCPAALLIKQANKTARAANEIAA